MERRVLVAILLSFVVLYGYQAFVGKSAPIPVSPTRVNTTPSDGPGQPAAPVPPPDAPATADPAAALTGDTEERDVRVETPQLVAVFTNRGARLKSWKLKKYHDRAGQPLELVEADTATTHPLPFSLRTSDPQTTAVMNSALYAVSETPAAGANEPTEIAFEYRSNTGLSVLKAFRIDSTSYTVAFHSTVAQNGVPIAPTIVWGPGLGDNDSQTGRYAVKPEAIYSVAGKVSRLAASAITKQPSYEQDFEYAGIDDHYFMSIALTPGKAALVYQPLTIPPAAGTTDLARDLMGYALTPTRADQPLTFYVGPKDFDTLALIDRNLVKAVNFGMFSVIVVPLLRSLNWIHGFVGNYGWSVALLTMFINLVMFPLNHKSVVSMRKMQEIQPETKAIQERYAKLKATDPAKQKMNQELMALYRERGVNPASGCIPILLTLPVFLAFYAMLQTAIELRGAPFVGWIHDLSLPDPYYVLPIAVGLSQLAQQWMTPQAGVDPTQQKMMLIMPIVLIFVFVSAPAGALIYWLVGNLWRIGQMQLTNYIIGPPNIRTIRPAAERRVKRVGAGKSEGAAREE